MNEYQIRKDEVESLAEIFHELKDGFEFLKKYPKTVSVLGSARFGPENKYYQMAEKLGEKVVKELKYGIVTGGGPGIMSAANKGAFEANGVSLGITIKLPKEQHTNKFITEELHCQYFFTRKTILTFAAEAYVIFPGGYGTFDEFFDVLTLIQTKKIPLTPIILVGKDFWNPFFDFIQKHMFEEDKAIDAGDLELYKITDDLDEVIGLIKDAPISRWWKHIQR